jgi:hypothetical protein
MESHEQLGVGRQFLESRPKSIQKEIPQEKLRQAKKSSAQIDLPKFLFSIRVGDCHRSGDQFVSPRVPPLNPRLDLAVRGLLEDIRLF